MRYVLLLPLLAAPASAGELTIQTGRDRDGLVVLAGRDAWQQLLVTNATRDATRDAAYSVEPAGVIEVDKTGLVTPRKNGTATLTVKVGTETASLRVKVEHFDTDVPINFAN